MGKKITLTAPDGQKLGAYRADPANVVKGGVVVIQEIFGVNHHIRAVCDRLAAAGYAAVAPALFDRVEPGLSPAIRRTRYRLQCGLCRTLILEPSYVIHLLLSVS